MLKRLLCTTLVLIGLGLGVKADDLTLWGYSLAPDFEYTGYNSVPDGPVSDAMFVPGNAELKGARIHAINLPICSSDYTKIKVWAAKSINEYSTTLGPILHEQAYNESVTANTYTRVELNEPWDIPAEGFYIGFTYTTNSGYPIARITNTYVEGSTWDNLWMGMWYEDAHAISAIQIFVSGMKLTTNSVEADRVSVRRCEKGSQAKAKVSLASTSAETITQLGYTINIGGTNQKGDVTLATPIEDGLSKKGATEILFTAPATAGSYEGTFTITSVNGKPNTSTKATPFKMNVVDQYIPRLTIVEEFTGTGCGNCPRGWLGMETVKEEQADYAAVIAIHQYNPTDPMYCANYFAPEYDGAPSCHIDRRALNFDPYYGDGTMSGIAKCIDDYNEVEPTVTIDLEAHYTDATCTSIVATAQTTFLANQPGSQIAFVVTADELAGKNGAWRQSNYYYDQDPNGMGTLAPFCQGGEYGESMVYLTYNDVLIASSWQQDGTNTAPSMTRTAMGSQVTTTQTLSIADLNAQMKAALHTDKVYVTAIVLAADGTISNAARCRVTTGTDGITTPVTTADGTQVQHARYLDGRIAAPQAKGITIMGGKKIVR